MTPTPCERVRRQLPAYLDGAVTGTALEDIERHLAACPECRDQRAFSRTLENAVRRSLADPPLPAGLESRVRQALDRSRSGRREGRERFLFLDLHRHVEGLTAEGAARAHQRDLEVQDRYGVRYLRYWYDEGTGRIFCLVEAPSPEAATAVHREAHGFVADEIVEVKEGT